MKCQTSRFNRANHRVEYSARGWTYVEADDMEWSLGQKTNQITTLLWVVSNSRTLVNNRAHDYSSHVWAADIANTVDALVNESASEATQIRTIMIKRLKIFEATTYHNTKRLWMYYILVNIVLIFVQYSTICKRFSTVQMYDVHVPVQIM